MHARVLAGLVAVVLPLTACSGDEPEDPAATLPPVTATPSPTAAAGEVPDEATEPTPEGAAEFASYFAVAVPEAYKARDPELIRKLSAADCETCQRYINSIETITRRGADINDSYSVEVLDAVAPTLEPGAASTQVTLFLKIGDFVVTAPDGSELAREAADDQVVQDFSLVRGPDGWLIQEIVSS